MKWNRMEQELSTFFFFFFLFFFLLLLTFKNDLNLFWVDYFGKFLGKN